MTWADCIDVPARRVTGITGNIWVRTLLDTLQEVYPMQRKETKFDSIAGWISEAEDMGLITHGEASDCRSALANHV